MKDLAASEKRKTRTVLERRQVSSVGIVGPYLIARVGIVFPTRKK